MSRAMMRQIVWFTFFLIFLSFSIEEDCSTSGDSNECCANFYIKDGKCTPCLSGYYGPNCNCTCLYPKFGRGCLEGTCQCQRENCDHVIGCRREEATNKNNYGVILERATSKGYVGNVNSPTIEEDIQSNKKIDEPNQNKSSPSSSVIVTSVVGAVIIIALIAAILFEVKGIIQARMQTVDTKRRSKVTSHRYADTYCDIDEDKMEDVECNMENELEPYELIDQSKKDATKYTELPTMQKILDDVGDDKDDTNVVECYF